MTVAGAMEQLVQTIIGSYDARIAEVDAIAEATDEQLSEFDRSHQAMAQEQRARLSEHHADLRASVDGQRTGFRKAHAAMAKRQRGDLAKVRNQRIAAEGARQSDFGAWMSEVSGAHAEARAAWENLGAAMRKARSGRAELAGAAGDEGEEEVAGSAPRAKAKAARRAKKRKIVAKRSRR